MIENFDEALLERIKARAQQDSRFIKQPPGRPRLSSKLPAYLASPQAPEVNYIQGTKKTCATDSFASALFYKSDLAMVAEVHNIGLFYSKNSPDINNVAVVRDFFNGKGRKLQPRRLKPHQLSVNSILVPSSAFRLVFLLGSDSDNTHAVTIIDNWIFDSGLERALPLTQDSLNYCCGDNTVCLRGDKGYTFVQRDIGKRKRQNQERDIDQYVSVSDPKPKRNTPALYYDEDDLHKLEMGETVDDQKLKWKNRRRKRLAFLKQKKEKNPQDDQN